jgi:colicin import membrane protein
MHAATDRLEFAPPPTPGMMRAFGLAVLAHVFLLAALTWGVHWKREAVSVTAEAELWSATPQQAAPKLVEVAPEPPETPKPPVVKPTPKPTPPPPQVQPKLPDADIALEREKLRLKKEKQDELEQQRLAKLKQEKLKQEKREQEELKQEKLLAKRDQDKKAADEQKKADQESKRKEAVQAQQNAKKQEAQRQENIKRMTGLAGATGSPGSSGTALRSSGPSASYGQRLAALFKKSLNFPNPESISGNPKATVEVRVSPSGLIMSSRLVTSSGVPSWDAAALRAVDKTERIPADENGNFVSVFPVHFGPKD